MPYYESRRVEILFTKRAPTLTTITVDGPTDSPHRYKDNQLCIWHPNDPEDNRWVLGDGLLLRWYQKTRQLAKRESRS